MRLPFVNEENKSSKKMRVDIKCVAGYSLEIKLKTSFQHCFSLYHFKIFHAWDKRKSGHIIKFYKTCKPFKEVVQWLNADDVCVLNNIEWFDHDLNIWNYTIYQDLRSIFNSLRVVSLEYLT